MSTPPRSSRWSEVVYIIVIVSLGLLCLFWEVFAQGYVQVPADILFTDPVMREAAPPDFTRPQNSLLADHIYQFYVWHSLAAQSMQKDGKIPLWDPYLLAGQPLVANAQPALFYPPNLLLFWLTPDRVATLRVFFNILVAGIFTFLFCRALQISFGGAVLSAISFAFSGAVMVGPGHAYANCLVWLPFCFWAVENLLTGSRVYFWGLVVGIGMGLSVVGGHPETTLHNLIIVSLYVAARLVFGLFPLHGKLRLGLVFLVAGIIGALLGAVQWLPFAEFLANSGMVSRGQLGSQGSYFYTAEWLPNVASLVTLLYPNFFGNPADLTYFWPFPTGQNYLEQSMYFGLIPVGLALGTGIAARKNQLPILILSILAVLSLAIALRLPGFEAFNYLPLLDRANNTRLKWVFCFLGATLAGFGLDQLRIHVISRGKEFRKLVSASALPILAVLAIFVIAVLVKAWTEGMGFPIEPRVQKFLATIFSLRQARTLVSVAAAVIVIMIYALLRWRSQWLRIGEGLIILVTFVELVVMARGYNTTMSPQFILPSVRLTQELQKDTSLYRILAIPPTFWPNYGAVYGLYYVGGYDLPVFKWSFDLNAAQGGKNYRQIWSPEWPLVDWMNVKYVISAEEQNLPKLKLVFVGDGYRVYRNENVLPRAYMVYQTQVVEDHQLALRQLISGTFDFKHDVLLESALPPDQAAMLSRDTTIEHEQQVSFAAYEDDAVTLDVSTSASGLLVMSDTYAPGWEAWVDGQLSRLYQANYAYRAVFVPAGHHQVLFAYRPWSFTWGSWLSILGIVILAVGIPLSLKTRSAQA